jgi:hypothetical protein
MNKDISEIDDKTLVKFRNDQYELREVIEKCQPGETIEGLSVEYFDSLLFLLREKRNKEYTYSTDRRYGNWRFILFGIRD